MLPVNHVIRGEQLAQRSTPLPLGGAEVRFMAAGVSAVPDAARISQNVGLEYDPSNYLLMHAMGPNVAGVIGSAVAAGILLGFLG